MSQVHVTHACHICHFCLPYHEPYLWVFKSVKFNFTYTDKIQSKWEKNIPKSPLSRSWRPRIFRPVKSTQKIASQQDRCFGWPTCCFGIRMVCFYIIWDGVSDISGKWMFTVKKNALKYSHVGCAVLKYSIWKSANLCNWIFQIRSEMVVDMQIAPGLPFTCYHHQPHLLDQKIYSKKSETISFMIYSQGPWFTHCAATAL